MTKITKLTDAQISAFPRYVKKWTAIGTSTEPADRPRAEAAIRLMYQRAELSEPDIVWCGSPLSLCLTHLFLKNAVKGASVRDSVWASVRDSVRASVWDSVWASVRASVRDSVWDSVRDSVGDSVWDSVFGQHEAGWLSLYDYFSAECELDNEVSSLRGLLELAQSGGWIIPMEGLCLASERHRICARDDAGLLHGEHGPAVAYPDGFEIHAWHGVRVPSHWIERRETLNPKEVLACENVEQRAAGGAIIGWHRMPKTVIDGDPETDIGALIEIDIGMPQPGRFLMAVCPRNGTICEGVPEVSDIDNLPINTAIAAQAWRDCLPQSEYVHPSIRT